MKEIEVGANIDVDRRHHLTGGHLSVTSNVRLSDVACQHQCLHQPPSLSFNFIQRKLANLHVRTMSPDLFQLS